MMKTKLTLALLVIFVMGIALPVLAQMDIGPKAIGLKGGYVDAEGPENSTFGVGAIVDLGTFMPQLGWEAEATYWSKSYAEMGASAKLRDIAILTSGKYFFPVPQSQFSPFIGAGVGVHLLKAEVDLPSYYGYGGGTASTSDSKFGFHFLGGSEMEFTPQISGFAEFRYALVSDADQMWIMGGIKYKLGVK